MGEEDVVALQPAEFGNEDEEAQYYLEMLRDGGQEQKIEARDRLLSVAKLKSPVVAR